MPSETFSSPQLHEPFPSSSISVFFRHSYLTSTLTDSIVQLLSFSWTTALWLYFFVFWLTYGFFSEVVKPKQRRKNLLPHPEGREPLTEEGRLEYSGAEA